MFHSFLLCVLYTTRSSYLQGQKGAEISLATLISRQQHPRLGDLVESLDFREGPSRTMGSVCYLMADAAAGDGSQVRMRCVFAWQRGTYCGKAKKTNGFVTSSQLALQTGPINHLTPIDQLDTLCNTCSLRPRAGAVARCSSLKTRSRIRTVLRTLSHISLYSVILRIYLSSSRSEQQKNTPRKG